jgi:hypothetical protein
MAEDAEPKLSRRLPPPQVVALNVCDMAWLDPWTGKRTLIGMFTIIHAPKFPVVHPIITVHATLTNGHGRNKIRMRLIDTDEVRPPVVDFGEQDFDFPDPRTVVDIQAAAAGIVFPEAGEYRVQLLADGELLSERRIIVVDVRTAQP